MAQITIADATPRVQYTVGGSSSTGPFTIPWPYFSDSDIKVYQDGTLKTITTHYTISGTAVDDGFSGGTVSFGSAIANATVTIERDVPVARTTDFPVGPFNVSTLNTTLDKIFAIGQWLETKLGRTVNRPFTSTETYSLDWPDGATTDPKVLLASSDGGLEFGVTDAAISAAATQATNAANSASAAASSASTAEGHKDTASYYAVKVDGAVTGTDFSSKAWAIGGTGVTDTSSKGAAKEWAIETSGTVDGTSYSAKEYAQGTQASTGGSAKSWSQDTDQVNGAGTNDRSAKNWAQGSSMTGSTLGGSSKDWAQVTGGTVDGSDYSSKEYAVGSTVAAGSAKEWALGGGGSFTEGTEVTSGLYSARKYASDASASASTATAFNKRWTDVVLHTTATLNIARANVGTYYVLDTSSNSITVHLPNIGTDTDEALDGHMIGFELSDATNSVTITRGGDNNDRMNGVDTATYAGLTTVGQVIHFIASDTDPDNWLITIMSQSPDASTTVQGIAELATDAEVLAGTDTGRVITPSSLVPIRQISQNSKSADYTLVAADAGKHIYHPGADTSTRTWTIPANASVAYTIGTAITFVNDTSAGALTIAITSDTLVLAPDGTTGSRTLAANGMATAIKMTATRWMISGSGLT